MRLGYLRRAGGSLLCQEGTNMESQELHLQVLRELRQQNPPPTSVTVARHQQTRLTRDSNSTDLVQLALRMCPRALQERMAAPPQPPHTRQQLSSAPSPGRGRAKEALTVPALVTPPVSSAVRFAPLPGAAKQSLFAPGRARSPRQLLPSTTTAASAAGSRELCPTCSSSLHICPELQQLHQNQEGKALSSLSPMSWPLL